MLHSVKDWDNAYANGPNIPGGERWPGLWVAPADAYRAELAGQGRAKLDIAYGAHERQRLDLFLPAGTPKGLVVFVHGGYWMRLDKSFWSHLARGGNAHGFAVAMPSYRLCPEVGLADITADVAQAIAKAMDEVDGPVALTGHSAGGHLVSRMICRGAPLSAERQARISSVVSISGLHDLRPLRRTAMNETLHIDDATALRESPALLVPVDGVDVTAWVGGAERNEFRRQAQLLANIWTGLGASTAYVEAPDRHHFDVIDELADPESGLVKALLGR
ncbi:putative hydrolase (Serine esterase) [Bradyrhizobium sp. ORS 278]|uniref:alpha/beta hydrolase n=1 Tax=Bradyrhizobium sp. (strain ORS 278) TaxID=114615 RepID=UPI0001507B6D|nr:alpha/beta hydrolase [Bradyrhizobium sp. ORS 278]CAL75413.1 putative hydrolase (Serine esterase) [Bradyrhizobium sp. ORS 278]